MAILVNHACRVFLNNYDISSIVKEFVINARVGEVVTTNLTLWGPCVMDESGALRIYTPGFVTPTITTSEGPRQIVLRNE